MENEPTQNMSDLKQGGGKGLWLVIGVIVVILLVSYYVWGRNNNPSTLLSPTPETTETATPTPPSAITPGPQATSTPNVKTFTIVGKSFSFSPAEIKVKKGDTVKIIFQNSGGTHDWVIDEFNARTPQIKSGETATVEFVADKVGQFEYYCSVGNHRAMGMKGKLIVE